MRSLLKYVPLHFLVLLILGIAIQFYTQFWTFGFLKLFGIVFFLLFWLLFIKKEQLYTIFSFILFFVVGVSSVYIQDARNFENHYSYFLQEDAAIVLRISKTLKSGFYHEKYIAKVIKINKERTRGELLLNIQKDSLLTPLKTGTIILVKSNFRLLSSPLNPNQFNYKQYLAKQGIQHQLFLENSQILESSNLRFSLSCISQEFRDKIQQSLALYNFKNDELAVVSALLLGQRQNISKDLLSQYANAGAIHILAVSGLHVGIILLMLSFLFTPLEKMKNGRYVKLFCIVLLLWIFAFIAGLSPSVVRAVTMFTFVAIGQSFHQKNKVAFSLISSMLLLLLVNPMFLFDVGFQLSYLAVFGIVWVQPKLVAIYKSKYFLLNKVWQLCTVSVAAQVGILPLTIYYFQQFPSLFIVSNLIIIPFLGTILIAGILVIFLALLKILPTFIAEVYRDIIFYMNSIIRFISKQEQFLFVDIQLSLFMMIACYCFIFCVVLFLIKKKAERLIAVFIAILCIQSISFLEHNNAVNNEAFIVFHKSKFSVIGMHRGIKMDIQYDIDSFKPTEIKILKAYVISSSIKTIQKVDFNKYLNFKGQDILLVDSTSIYQIDRLKNPIVVLQHSPKINLKRLFHILKPSIVVADGSNYKSYVNSWRASSKKKGIPFYYTGQQGAFVLSE